MDEREGIVGERACRRGAPGINAVVQGLRALPHTKVTVVVPLTHESGTDGKGTGDTLTATKANTASGYRAWAVHGLGDFAADHADKGGWASRGP